MVFDSLASDMDQQLHGIIRVYINILHSVVKYWYKFGVHTQFLPCICAALNTLMTI